MLGPEVGTQSLSARNSDGICSAKRSVSYCVGPNGPWLTMTGRAGRVWWGGGVGVASPPRRLTAAQPNKRTHTRRRSRAFKTCSAALTSASPPVLFHFAQKCDGNGNKRKVPGGELKQVPSLTRPFLLKNLFPPSRGLFSLFALCNAGAGAHIMSSKYRSRRGGTDCVRRLARACSCARGA